MGPLLVVGLGAMVLVLVYHADMFEAGLVGLWDAFVGVWRTLAHLRRDG
jgi:hypothetical protein